MKNLFYYETIIGTLGIADDGEAVTDIFFGKDDDPADLKLMEQKETKLIKEAIKQLREYFEGKRKVFDLPLKAEGTPFQKAAWDALLTIPYGEVRSYGQMARQVGNPKACRAIGMANNRNPIAIVIPCHRVTGSDGKLVGYGGGLHIKKLLLDIEGTKYKEG
ncbi:methylated-DNA--[protein]-cysteine S-methyltransferase [Bacillota bacterium]